MRTFIFLSSLTISSFAHTQTQREIDSVSVLLCDHLQTISEHDDTEIIGELYEKKLMPYLSTLSEKKAENTSQVVFYRLQRNCPQFSELLDRLEPPVEMGTTWVEKPVSKMTTTEVEAFKNQKKFKYLEVNGAVTKVIMNKGKWTDSFTDKTQSKLTYVWLNDTEFELTFIESNNETRSGFSFKGDKINYQVLSKQSDHYLMSINIPGQKVYREFKLYVD